MHSAKNGKRIRARQKQCGFMTFAPKECPDLYVSQEAMNISSIRASLFRSNDGRSSAVIRAAVTALAGKGLTLFISLLAAPLTLPYLGAERYGIWVTLNSVFVIFAFLDLGLGNGLLNSLANSYSQKDWNHSNQLISTATIMMLGISLALGLICMAVWSLIDWRALFNLHLAISIAEAPLSAGLALSIFVIGFPLTLVTKVYLACQEGFKANVWLALGNIAALVGLILAARSQLGLPWLIAATSGLPMIVAFLSAVYLFAIDKTKLKPSVKNLNKSTFNLLSRLGGYFLVIQIASLVIYQKDNPIIAYYWGTEQVTVYSVTWRTFLLATFVSSALFAPLWSAYTEAFAKDDYVWVRRAFKQSLIASLFITTMIVLPLVLWGSILIQTWSRIQLAIPPDLLICMGVWTVLSVWMSCMSCVLNAKGVLRLQAISASAAMIASVALSIYLVPRIGVAGTVLGTVLGYTFFALLPQSYQALDIVRRGGTDK